ncbi:MAG: ABC transporter permease, partial [Gemmatimonadetes bacterium]|nr:ABC transporter permease [Gemmatimonadota bacterium]
ALTLTTPLFFGLAPALAASKANLTDALKEGGRGGGAQGPGSLKGRRALIAIEVAMAIVLVSGTGLMVRSFIAIQGVDLGFNAENLLIVEVSPPASSYPSRAELSEYFDRAAREIEALPGVRSVGVSSWLPLNHETHGASFARPGMELANDGEWPSGISGRVSGSYFESMAMPMISGRSFTLGDGPDDPPVVIVSQLLADRYWPNESPVGHTILTGDSDDPVSSTIVGVVGDLQHTGIDSERRPYVYESLSQKSTRRRFMTIAAEAAPGSVAQPVRRVLTDIDASLPITLRPMSAVVSESTLQWSFGSALLAVFGLVAVLLASLGIYGMISFSVAQRRREMGIRIAMGASGASLRRLVVSEGLKLTAIGLVMGFVLSLGLGKVMSSILFGVSPFDPVTFGSVLVLFLIVAAVASVIPAVRAGRVDPLEALRAE